ncbi:hypothetical protein CYMTET_44039 [Cymbomonas tetramitiformis]|uniref:Uncharacterized protein n=1 Tax=Cymbomonas tetramitiformis TaxID=36881 RepID=A0AAE0C2A2_9CHLO|nr:hypothetical protein CYMTET_44039 [Cymbomonas tetramitiformis]
MTKEEFIPRHKNDVWRTRVNGSALGSVDVWSLLCGSALGRVEPPQEVHRDWREYLGQRFVKTTRTDSKYNKVNISEYHWFNYGVGEVIGPDGKQVLMADGSPQLQSHPGEVWMRKELNEKEPWVVLALRRNAPRDHSKWGKGLRTRDLPAVDGVLPITDPKFQLYHAPPPYYQGKIQDLHKLSKFLPDPAKAALYPPYVEGMLFKNNGSADAAVEEPEEPEEPEAPDELEEPVPAMPLATGLATAESSEDSSQSDDSGSESSDDDEPLAARLTRAKHAE